MFFLNFCKWHFGRSRSSKVTDW